MKIELEKEEVSVLLNALIENIAFDNDADEIKKLYNNIIEQVDIEGYDKI